MSRPTVSPDWATDANYAAGANPWSGTPTKSAPSAGKVQTGYVPAADDAAEEDNYILNNHANYIKYLDSGAVGTNLLVSDDFLGTTFTQNWTVSGTGTVATVADSANGANGAVKLTNGGGGAVSLIGAPLAIGTADLIMNVRLRVVTAANGNSLIGISGASGSLRLIWDNVVDGNWYYQLDGATAVTTGVAFSSTYQLLTIRRTSGTVYFYINGTLVYSGAYATSLTGSSFTLLVNADPTTDVRIDYAKMWADR